MRDFLLSVYRHAVESVNPARLFGKPDLPPGDLWLLAAGKAAVPMARRAEQVLGARLRGGLVVTRELQGFASERLEAFESGHPVPDGRSLEAGRRAMELASRGNPLLVLLSGGASALLEAPAEGLELDDLVEANRALLACGAPIAEVNAVRKHLSALKGGRLAERCPCHTLALSDVLGSDPAAIGSGPTAPDPTTFAQALAVVRRRGAPLPERAVEALRAGACGQRPETPKPGHPCFERCTYRVLADNRRMAEAALESSTRSVPSTLWTTWLEGEAREVGRVLAATAREMRSSGRPFAPPHCLVASGETTVTLRGDGRGGRCQELALSFALAAEGLPDVWLLAAGSDGSDGPTLAAGAVVDGQLGSRARAAGLEPADFLARNDAYPLLEKLGALVVTGPTGTNVNDLVLLRVN
ncbi:MAG: glycerate kinase [Candidatus Eremiobacterota bacterium]